MVKSSTLYHTISTLNDHEKGCEKKNVGNRENAGNQHFVLFTYFQFLMHLVFCLQNDSNLDLSKIVSFSKELYVYIIQRIEDNLTL